MENSKNNINKTKTILIAGGAGFIGSNLCRRVLQENNKVICLDNLFTGKMSNIQELLSHDNFKFINHDIIEPITTISENIDEIYHLACPASPPKYQIDPIYTLKINFIGTTNLLELAREKNSRILFSSTSEVYGEPEKSPQREDYRGNVNTVGIRSCYDEGKRVAETLVMDYHNKYGVDTRIVRIFNTYGPYMDKDDGRVVTNLIRQMLNNEDITIYGDGTQTRSFCYIEDQIEGQIRLMNSDYYLPVNIGNPREITINKLCEILKTLINTQSNISYHPLPLDDPTNRRPDIELARKLLDWQPETDIINGLKKTINYMKTILSEETITKSNLSQCIVNN
jgi:UDP-glucuronate decarboxylase